VALGKAAASTCEGSAGGEGTAFANATLFKVSYTLGVAGYANC